MHQKATQLRFGERVSTFLLDRVLGCHYQKQIGQGVGLTANADLSLRHGFQQSRLHFGWCPIDLIRQNQIVENWSVLKLKRAGLWAENIGACDIARQEVGGELNTVEAAFDAFCHLFDSARLGQTRSPLDQEVAVGEECQNEFMNQILLANNLLPQPVF